MAEPARGCSGPHVSMVLPAPRLLALGPGRPLFRTVSACAVRLPVVWHQFPRHHTATPVSNTLGPAPRRIAGILDHSGVAKGDSKSVRLAGSAILGGRHSE